MAIESYNGHLSKNFGYQEMIKSSTADRLGISNDASREHVINLVNLCNFILQPVREEFGVIRINSGYRSPALNKAVGGSKQVSIVMVRLQILNLQEFQIQTLQNG